MTDTLYTTQTPASDDLDFVPHFFGLEFTASANREAIGGRAWVPAAGRPPTFFWQLWRMIDSVLLAEVDLNNPGFGTPVAGTWMPFNSSQFITPGNVAVISGLTYVEGVYTDDGHFVTRSAAQGATFPIGTGVLSATTGRFRTNGLRTDPPTGTEATWFFADITVDLPGASAVPGTHVASGTASVLTASAAVAATFTPSGSAAALTASGKP